MRLPPFVSSFRFRATLLFAVLAMVTAFALSAVLGNMLSQRLLQDQGDRIATLARNTATVFADGLAERLREVQLLAENEALRAGAFDDAHVGRMLGRMLETRPNYQWIGIADTQGTVRVATGNMLVGRDVSERPWFKTGLEKSSAGDVHEAKLLAKLLPQPASGEPLRFVDYAAPVMDLEGRRIGVLGVHASWDWAREVASSMLPAGAQRQRVEILVLDREGNVIYPGQSQDKIGASAAAPGTVSWTAGSDYLAARAMLPIRRAGTDLGWSVVVRQPLASALEVAMHARRTALLAGSVAGLCFAVLAWLVAGYLGAPLSAIARAARAIQQGDTDSEIPRTGHGLELDRLSEALRGMTASLKERESALQRANETLESRVRERTVELQRANAELDKLARRDPLTGACNRRAADEALAQQAERFRRGARGAVVLLADIDFFKQVNDVHGHAVGDSALRHVAGTLMALLRGIDLVVRFGGEEFLVLLPETDLAGGREVAERLRAAIESRPPAPLEVLTLSIGVAALADQVDAALANADKALYAAKQAGRNRVVAAGEGA
ncbi:diguanylate cyclase [Niveibacterium sp. SC-1]|uniref:sensor domain-containing diguanylate cyclase n=1 Tax=Niveibacterium sp. SC-1 TaxID=3135646 RepID=UPI00311D9D8C